MALPIRSIRSKSTAEQTLAIVDNQTPAFDSIIDLDSSVAAAYGLPSRDFKAKVVGKFDNNEIGSAGYFLSISSSDLSDEELTFAHKRGLFQKPVVSAAASREVAVFNNESYAGGGALSTIKVYLTSPKVTDELWAKVEKELKAGLASVENEDLWKFDVQPFAAERSEWQPIDYALALGDEYKNDPTKFENDKNSWEVSILVDEQTVEDDANGKPLSVNVIYQLTQLPERKDIMRTARWGAKDIAGTVPAIIVGAFKFLDALNDNPDEIVTI